MGRWYSPGIPPRSTSMMVDRSIWVFSLLVLTVRDMCFCFSFPWLCCSMQSQSPPLSLIWEGLLLSASFFSFTASSPRPASVPKYFIIIYVSFILSYLLLKIHVWFSGYLGPVNSFHSLFSRSSSMRSQSLGEFAGKRVLFSSYSSEILGPTVNLQDPFY